MPFITTSDQRYELDTFTQTIAPNPLLPEYIAKSMPNLTYNYTTGEVNIDTLPRGDQDISTTEITAAHQLLDEIAHIFNSHPRALHPGHTTTPLTFGNKTFDELPAALWHPADGWAVGAILVSTWGYDQTNIDYWQVVTLSEKAVRVKKIYAHLKTINDMEFYATPDQHKFQHDPNPTIRRTIRTSEYDGEKFIQINDHSTAKLWDGRPVRGSSYC